MTRQDIIQKLINKINAQSYLEIGLGNGEVHKNINCKIKVEVDPCEYPITKENNIQPTFKLTSDVFFAQNQDTFDVIFIDGLHHSYQVQKDIENSLKILNPNGYIVCHDMSPEREEMQIIPMATALFLDSRVSNWGWTGDCWRAWVYFRSNHQDLSMFVIDTDYGCGVITRGSQTLINQESQELTFENFDNNRKEWLNLISAESFNEMIG